MKTMRILQILLDAVACIFFFYVGSTNENNGFINAGIWALVACLAHLELYGNED